MRPSLHFQDVLPHAHAHPGRSQDGGSRIPVDADHHSNRFGRGGGGFFSESKRLHAQSVLVVLIAVGCGGLPYLAWEQQMLAS